jgi:hypothetical protein
MRPELSFIICTRNHAQAVRQFAGRRAEVVQETSGVTAGLVVVNNGSMDGTARVLKAWADSASWPKVDMRVQSREIHIDRCQIVRRSLTRSALRFLPRRWVVERFVAWITNRDANLLIGVQNLWKFQSLSAHATEPLSFTPFSNQRH